MSALDQLQGCLTLSDTALAHDQHTFTKYVHQHTMDADTRSQLDLQPADDFCHQIRGALFRYHQRNLIVQAQILHIFIRLLAAAVNHTRNLTGKKLVIAFHPHLARQGIDVCLLHISDDLDTLPVKMIKKAR